MNLHSDQSAPPRRYVNITDTVEENKKLKAENFELRHQLYDLERQIPRVLDANGCDFTEKVYSYPIVIALFRFKFSFALKTNRLITHNTKKIT